MSLAQKEVEMKMIDALCPNTSAEERQELVAAVTMEFLNGSVIHAECL